ADGDAAGAHVAPALGGQGVVLVVVGVPPVRDPLCQLLGGARVECVEDRVPQDRRPVLRQRGGERGRPARLDRLHLRRLLAAHPLPANTPRTRGPLRRLGAAGRGGAASTRTPTT